MKHLTLILLLALAPLSWGENFELFCSSDGGWDVDSDKTLSKAGREFRFKLTYEAEKNALTVNGNIYGFVGTRRLECSLCEDRLYEARGQNETIALNFTSNTKADFYQTYTSSFGSNMVAGTCIKF